MSNLGVGFSLFVGFPSYHSFGDGFRDMVCVSRARRLSRKALFHLELYIAAGCLLIGRPYRHPSSKPCRHCPVVWSKPVALPQRLCVMEALYVL